MADRPLILIAGGYGVFGRLLARELLSTTPTALMLGGRNYGRALTAARRLGANDRVTPLPLDLSDPDHLARAAKGCIAVACTAGPFQLLDQGLPLVAVEAGAHWLDISDYCGWLLSVLGDRELALAASNADRTIIPGLSTVPALSGVLVRWCQERATDATKATITLYIGNRNAKGAAAVASALNGGLTDPRPVHLPVGRRLAARCESPDSALLETELHLLAEFRVALEWSLASRLLILLGSQRRLTPVARRRLARWLAVLSTPFSLFGSALGCLQVDLWKGEEHVATASLVGNGQRLAILPCALALEALLSGELRHRGVVHPATWLTPDEWIRRLSARGLEFRGEIHGAARGPGKQQA